LFLSAIFIQPTVSYHINDKLGVGGGLVVSTGSVTLQRDLPVQFANWDYASASLSGSAFGLGYNIGVQFNATEKFSLGFAKKTILWCFGLEKLKKSANSI
jgi:long-chain fatty acid transport protein